MNKKTYRLRALIGLVELLLLHRWTALPVVRVLLLLHAVLMGCQISLPVRTIVVALGLWLILNKSRLHIRREAGWFGTWDSRLLLRIRLEVLHPFINPVKK